MMRAWRLLGIAMISFFALRFELPSQARNCDPNPAAFAITHQVLSQGNNGIARIRVTGTVKNIGNCTSSPVTRIHVELLAFNKSNNTLVLVDSKDQASLMPGATMALNHEKDFDKRNQNIGYYRLTVQYLPGNMNADQLKRTDINFGDNQKDMNTAALYAEIIDDTRILTIVSGDNQRQPLTGSSPQSNLVVGTAKFTPLKVRLTDIEGNGLANVRVDFLGSGPQAMAVQLSPGGGQSAFINTDRNGYAELNQMSGKSAHCYYATGRFRIEASSAKVLARTFNLEVLPNPDYGQSPDDVTLTVLSGNAQHVPRSNTTSGVAQARFAPLAVTAKNKNGTPAANVNVVFKGTNIPAMMRVQLEPSGSGTSTVKTDGQGVATLNKLSGNSAAAYYANGWFKVEASCGAGKAVFDLEVTAAAPAASDQYTLAIVSGNNQQEKLAGDSPVSAKGVKGRARFAPLVVRLTDKNGAGMANCEVGFIASAAAPMAVQMSPPGPFSATVRTDAQGYARANLLSGYSLYAYYGTGQVTVSVSAQRASPITFSLRVLPQ